MLRRTGGKTRWLQYPAFVLFRRLLSCERIVILVVRLIQYDATFRPSLVSIYFCDAVLVEYHTVRRSSRPTRCSASPLSQYSGRHVGNNYLCKHLRFANA